MDSKSLAETSPGRLSGPPDSLSLSEMNLPYVATRGSFSQSALFVDYVLRLWIVFDRLDISGDSIRIFSAGRLVEARFNVAACP